MSSPLLTEAELAKLLHIGRNTLTRLKRDPVNPIPCLKVGRRYLYDLNKVKAWMARNAERDLRPARPRLVRRRA